MYVCKMYFKFRQSIFRFERNIDQGGFAKPLDKNLQEEVKIFKSNLIKI